VGANGSWNSSWIVQRPVEEERVLVVERCSRTLSDAAAMYFATSAGSSTMMR
jgi:hypothetical protein